MGVGSVCSGPVSVSGRSIGDWCGRETSVCVASWMCTAGEELACGISVVGIVRGCRDVMLRDECGAMVMKSASVAS